MSRRISHAVNGDRILITVEFPAEVITATDAKRTIDVTLDDQDWHDIAKGVLSEQRRAERALDPDFVSWRVEDSLRHAVVEAGREDADPDIIRRRAVSNILRRLADMALSGTITSFGLEWDDPKIDVVYETGRGSRRRAHRTVIDLRDPASNARSAPSAVTAVTEGAA